MHGEVGRRAEAARERPKAAAKPKAKPCNRREFARGYARDLQRVERRLVGRGGRAKEEQALAYVVALSDQAAPMHMQFVQIGGRESGRAAKLQPPGLRASSEAGIACEQRQRAVSSKIATAGTSRRGSLEAGKRASSSNKRGQTMTEALPINRLGSNSSSL